MNKFEDVDVIASLEAIMKQNTAFYQNDFDLDRNILQKAAASPTAEDRRLLWFSRPSGTSCFRERDVFLKGTRQHNTWRFYGEQTRDKVLAYAVELSPYFMQLASTKDTDRLFAMLPYKTLSFSKIEGRHGTFAFLDKSEDRSRNIRKARPSVRAQLTADKKTAVPKKAAAKRKNHDLEV